MIKINLLAVDRERAKRKSTFQIGQKLTVGCSLIVVAAALLVGWWYWSLQRESADLDQQIVDAQQETHGSRTSSSRYSSSKRGEGSCSSG